MFVVFNVVALSSMVVNDWLNRLFCLHVTDSTVVSECLCGFSTLSHCLPWLRMTDWIDCLQVIDSTVVFEGLCVYFFNVVVLSSLLSVIDSNVVFECFLRVIQMLCSNDCCDYLMWMWRSNVRMFLDSYAVFEWLLRLLDVNVVDSNGRSNIQSVFKCWHRILAANVRITCSNHTSPASNIWGDVGLSLWTRKSVGVGLVVISHECQLITVRMTTWCITTSILPSQIFLSHMTTIWVMERFAIPLKVTRFIAGQLCQQRESYHPHAVMSVEKVLTWSDDRLHADSHEL